MRIERLASLILAGTVLVGCDTGNRRSATARAEDRERDRRSAGTEQRADEVAVDPFASDGRWSAPKRTVFETAGSFNEEQRVARPAASSRPKSKAHVDVDLKGANLADALRFLANAGGFNLVIEDSLGSPVTVDLHDVDPYDALVVIAESQGFEVEYTRGIVRVGAAKPATAQSN